MNEEYMERFEDANHYVAVWTCDSPTNSHETGREYEQTIDQLVERYIYSDHDSCSRCEDVHDSYTGSLDIVVPLDKDGKQVTEAMSGEEFRDTYNMVSG